MQIKRVLAVTTTVALMAGVSIAAFGVDDAKEVRQADFIPVLSDTRPAGHIEFLEEGLHVYTDDTSSDAKASEFYEPHGATAGIPSSASQDWYGTDAEAAMQIVFDVDAERGNGNDFNIIVGEKIYGDDWWYTGGQTRAALRGITCPQTDSGSGSDCHGTLAEWQTAVPDAEVYALGFSLGSGVKGDGVLRAQTFGGEEYIFTDEVNAAPTTPEAHTQSRAVTAKAPDSSESINRHFVTRLATNSCPADDTCRGKKVNWKITIDGGSVRYQHADGWGESTYFRQVFSTDGGARTVKIYKNGTLVQTKTITTK